MYQIGEALIGEGDELAHIDLIIGRKDSPAGIAFANALSQLSWGHTPLLAVVRPNLMTKPATVIIPKVTVKNMEQAGLIFGPAQAAVAKAVADAVEEGIIPKDEVEDYVVIVSVFIHPEAKDKDKVYHYNYGATKLALQRAMDNFPDVDTLLYEKDRAGHPMIGKKLINLWDPPYLQVALDFPDLKKTLEVVAALPENDHLILEAGTPLIKRYGVEVIHKLREIRHEAFIVADLKTLDTGNLEARMAADATANAVVISGLAPRTTIDKAIKEAKKTGIYSIVDMLNVPDPYKRLASFELKPDVVEIHRAIDMEGHMDQAWNTVKEIKENVENILVAVAGGIRPENVMEAIQAGADILVVGRAITNARDVEGAARQFLKAMRKEDVDQFRIMTDF